LFRSQTDGATLVGQMAAVVIFAKLKQRLEFPVTLRQLPDVEVGQAEYRHAGAVD
jgi:hypothetical protein